MIEIESNHIERQRKEVPTRTPNEATRRRREALELTRHILAVETNGMDAGESKEELKKRVYEKVVHSLTTASQARLEDALDENKEKIVYFIRGGRAALNREIRYIQEGENLSDNEKEEKIAELYRDYAHAKLVEKLTIVRVVEFLLKNILNPYASSEELAAVTGSVKNGEHWTSNFDPDTNLEMGMTEFISEPKLEEIRAGIQVALQMRSKIRDLIEQSKSYDGRPDGRVIVQTVFGFQPKGRVKVVESSLSITLLFSDDSDYSKAWGDEKMADLSGGFHSTYLSRGSKRRFGDQFDRKDENPKGIVNCSKGSEFRASTVAHENEHSLYEITMNNRGKIKYTLEKVLEQMMGAGSEQQEVYARRIYNEFFFEAYRRFVASFANEALAYVLNNENDYSNVEKIVQTNYDQLTQTKLYSHHHITEEAVKGIKDDILYEVARMSKEHVVGSAEKESAFDFLLQRLNEMGGGITRQSIEETCRSIIRIIATLKQKGFGNDYIRALFAGESPARWPEIAEKVINFKSNEEQIKSKEAEALHQEKLSAWALIQSIDYGEEEAPSAIQNREDEPREGRLEIVNSNDYEWISVQSVGTKIKEKKKLLPAVEEKKYVRACIAARKEGEDKKNFSGDGVEVDSKAGGEYITFEGGRIFYDNGDKILDDQNKVVFDFNRKNLLGDNPKRRELLCTNKGAIVTGKFYAPDGIKRVVLREDGEILGMEYKNVKDCFLEQGELLMLVDTGSGSALIKESGEVVANFKIDDKEKIFSDGKKTYFFEAGGEDLYFLKDTNGNILGKNQGYTAEEIMAIEPSQFDGGTVLVDYSQPDARYFTLYGEEIPTDTNRFFVYQGDIYFKEISGVRYQNLEGKKIGREDFSVFYPYRRFSDGSLVFLAREKDTANDFYSDEQGNVLGSLLLEKYGKPKDIFKTHDGQYVYLVENSDKTQSLRNEGGNEILRGRFEQLVETDKGWIFGVSDDNKESFAVFNEKGEKISDDYTPSSENLIEYYETRGGNMVCNVIGGKLDDDVFKVIREKLKVG